MEIFVTYSRSNQEQVLSLVEDLEQLGHQVWFDHDLSGGQSWWDNILSEIRTCEVYVFAISHEALDSTACIRELKYAEQLQKSALPILMDTGVSMAMVPRYLSNMQYVDYSKSDEKNAVFALVKAINNLPPSPALPEVLPDPPPVPISYLDTLKEKVDARNLDKKDQISLVRDLKTKLSDPQVNQEDIIILLKRLRKHDDLLASVGSEIDELLAGTNKKTDNRKQAPHIAPKEPIKPPPRTQFETINTPPVQEPKTVENVHSGVKKSKQWNAGLMIGLIVITLIIPFVGLVVGIIGFATGVKQSQSGALIGVAVVMMILYGALYF